MNQDKRNKRNSNYKKNLEKRYGLTQKSIYKLACSKGIEKSDNIKPLLKEFITTKRNGKIVSREIHKYEWTKVAKDARKTYHNTKNGIQVITKPKEQTEKLSKQQKLDLREYSKMHNDLVNNLYSNTTTKRREKQILSQQAHNAKIQRLTTKLREQKLSKQQQNLKQRPREVVLHTEDGKKLSLFKSGKTFDNLVKYTGNLHKTLSNRDNYKAISIIHRPTEQNQLYYIKAA